MTAQMSKIVLGLCPNDLEGAAVGGDATVRVGDGGVPGRAALLGGLAAREGTRRDRGRRRIGLTVGLRVALLAGVPDTVVVVVVEDVDVDVGDLRAVGVGLHVDAAGREGTLTDVGVEGGERVAVRVAAHDLHRH